MGTEHGAAPLAERLRARGLRLTAQRQRVLEAVAALEHATPEAIGARLPLLSPDEDEAMLRECGFTDVHMFYAGLAQRGWVGYA